MLNRDRLVRWISISGIWSEPGKGNVRQASVVVLELASLFLFPFLFLFDTHTRKLTRALYRHYSLDFLLTKLESSVDRFFTAVTLVRFVRAY